MVPPRDHIGKPCGEYEPFDKKDHKWSWTKERQGAGVRLKSGEWHHKYLAHQLYHHGLVLSVEPQQNKLNNSKATDHESDTDYKCCLPEPMPASSGGKGEPASSDGKRPGSSSKGMPASGGEGEPASGGTGWGALMGYSRHKDKVGQTHGWVQFGKHCVSRNARKRCQLPCSSSASGSRTTASRIQSCFRRGSGGYVLYGMTVTGSSCPTVSKDTLVATAWRG
jgi:hypothetical protein